MSPEHRGYRTALWRMVSDNMYAEGDFYVPADELFFNTTALADEVLEQVINLYNFKQPKTIKVIEPRYTDKEKATELMEIDDYCNLEETEIIYIPGDKYRVIITEDAKNIIVAIMH